MTALNRTASISLTLGMAMLLATGVHAADNPWVGTWKLDAGKSHLIGETVRFSKTTDGKIHYSGGGLDSYDFTTDGKEYPRGYGRTVAWTEINDHEWKSVIKVKSTVMFNAHRELSPDGKMLTLTVTGTKPDGTAMNEVTVYRREGDSTGLVGIWRDVKSNGGAPQAFVVSSPSADVMRWEIPEYKSSVEGKFDGSELPMMGPQTPAGETFSATLKSPTEIAYVLKFKGKIDARGTDTLAADGKSYTDVSWLPGKEKEKATALYFKE